MTDQTMSFVLIFICVLCISICQLGSKKNTKTARRFWYSAIASQIGGVLLGYTTNLVLQVIIMIATVFSLILSIIFGIQLYKETKKRRSERDSLEESE